MIRLAIGLNTARKNSTEFYELQKKKKWILRTKDA